MITRTATLRVTLLAFVVATAACGDAHTAGTSSVPTAPSSGTSGPVGGTGSATISGTLGGATSSTMQLHASAVALTVTITVTGTGISTTVSPGGAFVLNGVPSGNVELHFAGPGIDARATITDVSDSEEIRIVVTLHGSNAAVNVTDRTKPANAREIEGLIASINLTTRTLVVNGTTVSVPTDAIIRHGNQTLSFSQLKVGQRVHVRGTFTGSTVVASEVKLQDENPPGQAEAEVEGVVSARSGSCPAVTFTVNTTKVSTDTATQFKGGTCATIANGVKIEVEGARQADGSIRATHVEFDKDSE